MPFANRFAQRADSRRGRVFRASLFEGANRGALDVLRSRKVRLAGAEVGQVGALGAKFSAAAKTAEVGEMAMRLTRAASCTVFLSLEGRASARP